MHWQVVWLVRIHFSFFLLDLTPVTQEGNTPPPPPLISLKQEYLISLNFGLWFLLSLSFSPWRRGKTLNFVQSKLNYEENSLELNKMNWALGTESKHCRDVVDSLTMTHKHISHFDTPLIWLITLKAGWQADWIAQVS